MFAQGGQDGFRLVFLTPPIAVLRWRDRCEARWTPAEKEKPFKYTEAPILVHNRKRSHFPLLERFARETARRSIEAKFSSRFRSRTRPLSVELANEVVSVYERMRAAAPRSAFASTYNETLPYGPPMIDRNRKTTYRHHVRRLMRDSDGAKGGLPAVVLTPENQAQSRCGLSQHQQSDRRRTRRCT